MPARGGKGTTWTPELERHMLILAITVADLKPSTATWNLVAQAMGNGITASAVSQKFGKLKKAFESDNSGAAAATAPSVATPPVAPSHAETKTTPAVAVRKRKATTTAEATKDLPKKKLKQVKKESEDEEQAGDGEDATEVVDGASDGDTPSPGEEGANKDQATRIKAEE